MQILSDNVYRIKFFQTKVHTPAINRNLGIVLEFYTNMIKSNFTVSLMWFTLIMYVKAASYTFRMLTASNVD